MLQLLLWHQAGGTAHEVGAPGGLGEGNYVPDARSSNHDGDQPVQT